MRDLIDRSLAEVRLRGAPAVEFERCRLINVISEVEVTASVDAEAKSVGLFIEVAPDLEVFADRHLIVSAISNLVQNAVKFTRRGGSIKIVGRAFEGRVSIDVEDQCGGLPPGKADELFQPFSQKAKDKSGLGLGLTIASRAVALNNGSLSVRDIPHCGCVFTIDLPLAPPA